MRQFRGPRKQRGIICAAVVYDAGGGTLPEFLAANTGTLTSTTTTPSITVNFGDETGNNRMLIGFYFGSSTTRQTADPLTATYDGVTGTQILESSVDGGQALSGCFWYWLESELPSTSGNKTLAISGLNVSQLHHTASMILAKNIDQEIFISNVRTALGASVADNTTNSRTALEAADSLLVSAAGCADASGTYVSGDINNNSGALNVRSEVINARHAHRSATDQIPDASEAYVWQLGFGGVTIDSFVRLELALAPVKETTPTLDTTVTSGSAVVYTTTSTYTTKHKGQATNTFDHTGYGFDAGSDYNSYVPGFGSIASGVYTDGSSTSRTIDSCYWVDTGEEVSFVIDTTSVPNTDDTFHSIEIDGTFFLRADASYVASADGGTAWLWGPQISNPFIGANPDPFKVYLRA